MYTEMSRRQKMLKGTETGTVGGIHSVVQTDTFGKVRRTSSMHRTSRRSTIIK